MGYSQDMKRNFSVFSVLGVGFSLTNSWFGISAALITGINSGGPVLIVYGIILIALISTCVGISLSELASAYPNAGGQCFWAMELAPRRYAKLASYLTGWFSWAGSIFTSASVAVAVASACVGCWQLSHPELCVVKNSPPSIAHSSLTRAVRTSRGMCSSPIRWSTFSPSSSIATAKSFRRLPPRPCIRRSSLLSSFWSRFPPKLRLIKPPDSYLQILSIRPGGNRMGSVRAKRRGIAREDWLIWSAFIVGLINTNWAFACLDCATHMAEEVVRPEKMIPIAIMGTVAIGFVTAWFYSVAMFFSIDNLQELFDTETGVPILALYYQALGSRAGAIALESLIIATGVGCLIASQTWQCRLCWSFARDRGLPFSQYLSKVDKKLDVPLRAHVFTSVVVAILGCLYLGSYTAFNRWVPWWLTRSWLAGWLATSVWTIGNARIWRTRVGWDIIALFQPFSRSEKTLFEGLLNFDIFGRIKHH